MRDWKTIIISLIITAIVVFCIVVGVVIFSIGYDMIEIMEGEDEGIIYDEVVIIAPGNTFYNNLSGVKVGTTITWKWTITNISNEDIVFWLEDEQGNRYNFISTSSNFTVEIGFYDVERRGDYTLVWKNNNLNDSVAINITEVDELVLIGGEGVVCNTLPIILIIALVAFFFFYKKKYMVQWEDKKISIKNKIIIISIVILLCTFAFLPVLFAPSPDEKQIHLESFGQYEEHYSEMLEEDYISWHLEVYSDNDTPSLQFWLEDEDGVRYKYFNTSGNLSSNDIFFIVPKDNDYRVVLENPTNQSADVFFKFNPDTTAEEQLIGGISFLGQILIVLLIFLDVYMVIKNRLDGITRVTKRFVG